MRMSGSKPLVLADARSDITQLLVRIAWPQVPRITPQPRLHGTGLATARQ